MLIGFIARLGGCAVAGDGCVAEGISVTADASFFSDDLHAIAPSNATVQQLIRNTRRVRKCMDFVLRQKQQWMASSSIP
jgi:hypothetical protein